MANNNFSRVESAGTIMDRTRCASEVTYAVTSQRPNAVLLNLLSVLTGTILPLRIILRLEGELSGLSEFYLQAVAALARAQGVCFSIFVECSFGIRYARDFLIDQCDTEYLWMGDDDVVFTANCLWAYLKAIRNRKGISSACYFIGPKVDVQNLRGYADWDLNTYSSPEGLVAPQNHFYSLDTVFELSGILDTGNCLFNVATNQKYGLTFSGKDVVANSGGEDAVFAVKAQHFGLSALLVTQASAFHLEKSSGGFTDQSLRKELVRLNQLIWNEYYSEAAKTSFDTPSETTTSET